METKTIVDEIFDKIRTEAKKGNILSGMTEFSPNGLEFEEDSTQED